jgi:glycerophosphoryl diester phosphodiesterase
MMRYFFGDALSEMPSGVRGIGLMIAGFFLLAGCVAQTQEGNVVPEPPEAPQFDLQGHRGARGRRPENTLPAFEYALDVGVTTLELDLHLTKDGVVVVIHDDVVGKNCHLEGENSPPVPAPQISHLTLAEVKQYRCDLNPDPGRFPDQVAEAMPLAGEDYAIPTLEEVFQFARTYADSELKTESQRQKAAEVRFNIETKRKPDHPEAIGDDFDGQKPGLFEERIVELVEEFSLADRVTIQSFDHRSIDVIPQLNPEIETVALTSGPDDPGRIAAETSASIWSPDYRTLTAEKLAAAHEAGLLVVPWTVDEPGDMEKLIELGVDGLITDYPDRLAEILAERGIRY